MPSRVRHALHRLRQTFFHAQIVSVNLALIPDWNHFLEACVCFLRLTSFGRSV